MSAAKAGLRRTYPTGPLWEMLCDTLITPAAYAPAAVDAGAAAAGAAADAAPRRTMPVVPRDVVAIVHAFASSNTRILCYGYRGGSESALPYSWSVYDPTHGHTVDPDEYAIAQHVSAQGSGSSAPQEQWSVEPTIAVNSATGVAGGFGRGFSLPNSFGGGGVQFDGSAQQLRLLTVSGGGYGNNWQSRAALHVLPFAPLSFVPFEFAEQQMRAAAGDNVPQPTAAHSARADGSAGPFHGFELHSYLTNNYSDATSCVVDGVMYVFGRYTGVTAQGGYAYNHIRHPEAEVVCERFDFARAKAKEAKWREKRALKERALPPGAAAGPANADDITSAHRLRYWTVFAGPPASRDWEGTAPEGSVDGKVRSATVCCAIPEHKAIVLLSGGRRMDLYDCVTRTWHPLTRYFSSEATRRPGAVLAYSAPHARLYIVCGGQLQDDSSATVEHLQFPLAPVPPQPPQAEVDSVPAAAAAGAGSGSAGVVQYVSQMLGLSSPDTKLAASDDDDDDGDDEPTGPDAIAAARNKRIADDAARAAARAKRPAAISPLARAMQGAKWTPLPDAMGYARVSPHACVVDGELHVLGGIGMFGRRVNAVEKWSPSKLQWIECPPAPVVVQIAGVMAIQHSL